MKALLCILLALTLAGCGGAPLSLLTGGGPNVAANVQAGKTNSQTVGLNKNNDLKITRPQARTIEQSTGNTSVRTERVDTLQVTNVDWWVVALLCFFAGILFPSHREIARWLRERFSRKEDKSPLPTP